MDVVHEIKLIDGYWTCIDRPQCLLSNSIVEFSAPVCHLYGRWLRTPSSAMLEPQWRRPGTRSVLIRGSFVEAMPGIEVYYIDSMTRREYWVAILSRCNR